MCLRLCLKFALFCFVLVSSAFGQAPVAADVSVAVGSSINAGSANKLTLNVAAPKLPESSVYLRFSLDRLPPGARADAVAKATMRLYVSQVTTTGSFSVYRVSTGWTEAALIDFNRPTLAALEVSGVPVVTKDQYVLIDVTNLVKGWLNGDFPNEGLALFPDAGTSLSIVLDSKETTANSHDADLQIDYTDANVIDPIKAQIAQEILDRQNEDVSAIARANAHTNQLVAEEENARSIADAALQTQITAEGTERQTSNASLSGAISSEASRAQAAEAAIQTAINPVTTNLTFGPKGDLGLGSGPDSFGNYRSFHVEGGVDGAFLSLGLSGTGIGRIVYDSNGLLLTSTTPKPLRFKACCPADVFDADVTLVPGGNLGIGTINPTTKLDVVGSGRFTGTVQAGSFVGLDGASITSALSAQLASIGTFNAGTNPVDWTQLKNVPQLASEASLQSSITAAMANVARTNQSNTFSGGFTNLFSGSVAVGTTVSPVTKFHVVETSTSGNRGIMLDANNDISTIDPAYMTRRSRGTASNPTAVQNGDAISLWVGRGHTGSHYSDAAGIQFQVDGTTTPSTIPGRILFYTTGNGGLNERMRINSLGNVGIGTTSPEGVGGYNSLHINNPTNGGFLQLSRGNSRGRVVYDGNGLLLESTDPAPMRFKAGKVNGGTDSHLMLLPSGNFGIGTINPTTKLDVVGGGRFTGSVQAGSFIGDGSGLTNLPTSSSSNNLNCIACVSAGELDFVPATKAALDSVNASLSAGLEAETTRAQAAEATETAARQADVAALQSAIAASSGIPSGTIILAATATPPAGFTFTGDRLLRSGTDQWAIKASAPANANVGGVAFLNGKFYVAGGCCALASLNIYDPAANEWSTGNSMQYPRYHSSVVTDGQKIFVIGGYNNCQGDSSSNACFSSRLESYDPSTGVWELLADIPGARYLSLAAYWNGKIYVFGGYGPTGANCCNYLQDLLIYDIYANTWSEGPPLPPAQFLQGAALTYAGSIFLFNGGTDLYRFNPVDGSYTTLAQRLEGTCCNTAVALNNLILLIGNGPTQEYDPAADTWSNQTLRSAPYNTFYGAAAVVGNEIYVVSSQVAATYRYPRYYYAMLKN